MIHCTCRRNNTAAGHGWISAKIRATYHSALVARISNVPLAIFRPRSPGVRAKSGVYEVDKNILLHRRMLTCEVGPSIKIKVSD